MSLSQLILVVSTLYHVSNALSSMSGTCMATSQAVLQMGGAVSVGNANQFSISVTPDDGAYNPNIVYRVTITNNGDPTINGGFRGLLLYATGPGGSNDRVGSFGTVLNKTQVLACSGDAASTITHTSSGLGNRLFSGTQSFFYQPPNDFSVQFIQLQAVVYIAGAASRSGVFYIPQPLRINNANFNGQVRNVNGGTPVTGQLNDPGLSGNLRLGDHDIQYNIDTVAMTISFTVMGAATQWLGLGFGNTRMANTYALIFDNRGVTEWILGNNAPGSRIEPQGLTTQQRTVTNNIATYTASRPLTATNNGFTFRLLRSGTCLPIIPVIWARGFGTYNNPTIVHQSRGNEATIGSAECTGAAQSISIIITCLSTIFVYLSM